MSPHKDFAFLTAYYMVKVKVKFCYSILNGKGKGKGKVFALQAYTGPWGTGRLKLPDFLDFRHYEGGNVVTLTHRPPLPPGVFLVLIFRG
jgi:hypothetical protein